MPPHYGAVWYNDVNLSDAAIDIVNFAIIVQHGPDISIWRLKMSYHQKSFTFLK